MKHLQTPRGARCTPNRGQRRRCCLPNEAQGCVVDVVVKQGITTGVSVEPGRTTMNRITKRRDHSGGRECWTRSIAARLPLWGPWDGWCYGLRVASFSSTRGRGGRQVSMLLGLEELLPQEVCLELSRGHVRQVLCGRAFAGSMATDRCGGLRLLGRLGRNIGALLRRYREFIVATSSRASVLLFSSRRSWRRRRESSFSCCSFERTRAPSSSSTDRASK